MTVWLTDWLIDLSKRRFLAGIINAGTAENKLVLGILRKKTREVATSLFAEKANPECRVTNATRSTGGDDDDDDDEDEATTADNHFFNFDFSGLESVRQSLANFFNRYFVKNNNNNIINNNNNIHNNNNNDSNSNDNNTTCVKSISHRIFNISLQKLNQILKIMEAS